MVEYYDEAYDLAVISFNSANEYAVLPIASGPPEYNEPVATIGNPNESDRNTITVGKIASKEPVPFGDMLGQTQYNIIEHTAEVHTGSSGSALLNEDMEIVGVNLGGSENLFHQFLRGKAMPCDRILDFIYDMDNLV